MTEQVKPKKFTVSLSTIALLAIAFSIVLPIRVNSVVSITALSFYLIVLARSRNFDVHFFKTPLFLLVITQASILLLGLIHTSDLSQGFADIERFGYALLFPFLLYQMRESGINTKSLIIAFSAGCAIVIIYGLGFTLMNLDGKKFSELGHTSFTDPMDIHPMYLSLYISFIIFFLLETMRRKYQLINTSQKLMIGLAVLSLIVVLLLIRSQMSLLTFAIMSVLYLVMVLKRRAWLVTFALFTIGLLAFLLDTKRVATFFDSYGKNVSSALDNRFKVWGGAIEAIKESPIIGGGTGAEHQMLNKAYVKIGYTEGEVNSYNAHNQYLEFLIRNGPLELIVFLLLVVYAFKQSLRFPDYTFILFCMMFCLTMLSESSLQLHKGIVFFYFFLSSFVFLPFEKDSSKNF